MANDVIKAFMFLDTNIDTHICITPLDSTVREVKKSIEEAHLSIFPNKGEMKVTRLLMKNEQHFYMLSNCVTMRSVFPGVKQPWYLHVEMKPITHHSPQLPSHLSNHSLELIPFNPVEHHQPILVDLAIKEPTTTARRQVDSLPHSSTKTMKRQMKSLSKCPRKTSKRKKKSLARDDELASKTSESKKRRRLVEAPSSSFVSPLKVFVTVTASIIV